MSKRYTRRDFIKTSTIGFVSVGTLASMGKMVAGSSGENLPNPYPVIPDTKTMIHAPSATPLFFNEHQYRIVAEIASLIVPTDDDPGAAEADVASYIDRLAAGSEKKGKLYVKGIDWLDAVSKTQYDTDFSGLTVQEQIDLLKAIDEAESKVYRYVEGIIDRIVRKIDEVWNDIFGVGQSSKFFRTIREDVFFGYYANPVSWKAIGYYGPPQPYGYEDYADTPSPDNYIDSMRPVRSDVCLNCHFDQMELEDHKDESECLDCHEPHISLLGIT